MQMSMLLDRRERRKNARMKREKGRREKGRIVTWERKRRTKKGEQTAGSEESGKCFLSHVIYLRRREDIWGIDKETEKAS